MSTEVPPRFPHENDQIYADRQEKYKLILETVDGDVDRADALSMVYSNIVNFQCRYPTDVEKKLEFIPEVAAIISIERDDAAQRANLALKDAEAFLLKKKK